MIFVGNAVHKNKERIATLYWNNYKDWKKALDFLKDKKLNAIYDRNEKCINIFTGTVTGKFIPGTYLVIHDTGSIEVLFKPDFDRQYCNMTYSDLK